jgi:hypothetical protein
MGLVTPVSSHRNAGRWRTALAISLGVHAGILIFSLAGSAQRRIEPAPIPVPITIVSAPPAPALPSPPAVAAAENQAAPPRSNKPVVRSRSDHATNRLASLPATNNRLAVAPAPPSEGQPTLVSPAPLASGLADTDGTILVASASAEKGSGRLGGSPAAAPGSGVRVGPRILRPAEGEGQLAMDPNEDRYQPVIPLPLRKSGAKFTPKLMICSKQDGSVGEVTVLRPSDPAVDPAIVQKVRLYKFKPYVDHGQPIPFCFPRDFDLRVQ